MEIKITSLRILKNRLIRVLSLILGIIVFSTEFSNTYAAATRVYPASVDGFATPSDDQIAVRYRVTNDGAKDIILICNLKALDKSNTVLGNDSLKTEIIKAGATPPLVGNIKIPTQAASLIKKVLISCKGDSKNAVTVKSSNGILIKEINDCLGGKAFGAYDSDSNSWYWGSCAKAVGLAPNTHIKCTEKATDVAGKLIDINTFNATTFNDGSITGYGPGQSGVKDTTKGKALAIKNISWSCVRN